MVFRSREIRLANCVIGLIKPALLNSTMPHLNPSVSMLDTGTTVYSKTNAGRLLAFDQKPGMARVLRDLLRKVDGKTSYQELVSLPEEVELFAELYQRGLVQIAPEPWRNSSAVSAFSDSTANKDACLDAQAGQRIDVDKKVEPHLTLVVKPDNTLNISKMNAIKSLMSDFIQYQLPKHAATTLPEINALTNEAQLLCMLSGYINLIDPVGKAGQAHIQNLLLILAGDA
jgi:hypothetical protein